MVLRLVFCTTGDQLRRIEQLNLLHPGRGARDRRCVIALMSASQRACNSFTNYVVPSTLQRYTTIP